MKKRTQEQWLKLLDESHKRLNGWSSHDRSRLEYLSESVFGINTYDSDMDAEFARRAVEASLAISNKTTFEYIKDVDQYRWFLLMCHIPFFADRIEWGGSIRGAWWDSYSGVEFQSCGLFEGDDQLAEPFKFDEEEWQAFIDAVCEYAQEELGGS